VRVLRPGGYLVLLEIEYHIAYVDVDESPEIRNPAMHRYVLPEYNADA
jgi:hypothetical protein